MFKPIKLMLAMLITAALVTGIDASPAAAKVKIEFWFPVGVQGPIAQRVQNKVAQYNSMQNEVEVLPSFTGGYDDNAIKAQASIEAGRPPDVVLLSPYNTFDFWLAEYIEPIDSYLVENGLDPDEFFADFWPANDGNVKFKGKRYAIPFQNSVNITVWNCEHMEEVGLSCDDIPDTWDEFIEATKKLTKREGGEVTRWGVMLATEYDWFGWTFHGFVLANGGDFYNTGFRGEVYYDNPTTRGAMQFWRDLAFKHEVMPKGVLSGKACTTAWFAGKSSVAIISTGSLTFLRDNAKHRYALGFIPQHVRNMTTIGGAAMTIIKKDRTPEERKAVWHFTEWMTNAENLAEWSRKSGYSAPRKSSYQVPEHVKWGETHPETLKALEPLKCCAYPQFQVYKGVEVRKAIEDQAQAVMTGKKSVEEALAAAQKRANEIMRPYIEATVLPPK